MRLPHVGASVGAATAEHACSLSTAAYATPISSTNTAAIASSSLSASAIASSSLSASKLSHAL